MSYTAFGYGNILGGLGAADGCPINTAFTAKGVFALQKAGASGDNAAGAKWVTWMRAAFSALGFTPINSTIAWNAGSPNNDGSTLTALCKALGMNRDVVAPGSWPGADLTLLSAMESALSAGQTLGPGSPMQWGYNSSTGKWQPGVTTLGPCPYTAPLVATQECPPGTDGTYPDCTIAPPTRCPDNYTGTYPNCKAPAPTPIPPCPDKYTGTYPNCKAPPAAPGKCPDKYTGTYPNCKPPPCPSKYTGTFPNCKPPAGAPPPTTSNAGMWIGIGAGALALTGLAVFMFSKKKPKSGALKPGSSSLGAPKPGAPKPLPSLPPPPPRVRPTMTKAIPNRRRSRHAR